MALSATIFEIFSIFICIGNPIPTPDLGVLGVEHPQKVETQNFDPNEIHVCANPRVLGHFALI